MTEQPGPSLVEWRANRPQSSSLRERLPVETTRGADELFVVSDLDGVLERIRDALPDARGSRS